MLRQWKAYRLFGEIRANDRPDRNRLRWHRKLMSTKCGLPADGSPVIRQAGLLLVVTCLVSSRNVEAAALFVPV